MQKTLLVVLAMLGSTAAATAAVVETETPVSDLQQWTSLQFRSIPANTVTVKNGNLNIEVNKSASPLIHELDEPLKAASVTVKASWSGKLNIPQGVVQGEAGADDFTATKLYLELLS